MQILLEKASGILENIAAWKSSQPPCRVPRARDADLTLLWGVGAEGFSPA